MCETSTLSARSSPRSRGVGKQKTAPGRGDSRGHRKQLATRCSLPPFTFLLSSHDSCGRIFHRSSHSLPSCRPSFPCSTTLFRPCSCPSFRLCRACRPCPPSDRPCLCSSTRRLPCILCNPCSRSCSKLRISLCPRNMRTSWHPPSERPELRFAPSSTAQILRASIQPKLSSFCPLMISLRRFRAVLSCPALVAQRQGGAFLGVRHVARTRSADRSSTPGQACHTANRVLHAAQVLASEREGRRHSWPRPERRTSGCRSWVPASSHGVMSARAQQSHNNSWPPCCTSSAAFPGASDTSAPAAQNSGGWARISHGSTNDFRGRNACHDSRSSVSRVGIERPSAEP